MNIKRIIGLVLTLGMLSISTMAEALNWDSGSDTCSTTAYARNVHSAVLWGLTYGPWLDTSSWIPTCMKTRSVNGVIPTRCNWGLDGRVYGEWDQEGAPRCTPRWEGTKELGCVVGGANQREFYSTLMNIPYGMDWKFAAYRTPITIAGYFVNEIHPEDLYGRFTQGLYIGTSNGILRRLDNDPWRLYGSFVVIDSSCEKRADEIDKYKDPQYPDCLGGQGNECKGAGDPTKNIVVPKAVEYRDGSGKLLYVTLPVSIGSIEHDNCCSDRKEVGGEACSGATSDQLLYGADESKFCGVEFNHAVQDLKRGRTWIEKFPILDADKSKRDFTARRAYRGRSYMSRSPEVTGTVILNSKAVPTPTLTTSTLVRVRLIESVASSNFKAPVGMPVDSKDEAAAFCIHGTSKLTAINETYEEVCN